LKENDLDKIARYITGMSDDKEKAWVESLFVHGEDDETLRHLLRQDWDYSLQDTTPSDVDLNHLLDRVHRIMKKDEHHKEVSVLQRFLKGYRKVAAILLVPVMIAGGLIYSRLNHQEEIPTVQQVKSTIYAPMGARVSFNLPDGTTGMLNSGSRLTYSLPFNNDRKVSLEGEAWFDVARDEEHPFELNTGISTVRVLGTSFNLSAYPAEDYVEIVLKEGKVEFLDNQSHVKTTILPSERLVLKDGHIGKTVTDPAKYQAWTKGRMVFNNDPMAEVARRIERWYNVKVVLADKGLESYSFRGTFEDDKLEEVFRLLSLTSPITYRIIPRKILQDGSYEKEIVTVYLK